MSKLTEDEREAMYAAAVDSLPPGWSPEDGARQDTLTAAVEAIITARLARVEALAESISGEEGVEHNPGCMGEPDCLACIVEDLYAITRRAALAAAPSREADQ